MAVGIATRVAAGTAFGLAVDTGVGKEAASAGVGAGLNVAGTSVGVGAGVGVSTRTVGMGTVAGGEVGDGAVAAAVVVGFAT